MCEGIKCFHRKVEIGKSPCLCVAARVQSRMFKIFVGRHLKYITTWQGGYGYEGFWLCSLLTSSPVLLSAPQPARGPVVAARAAPGALINIHDKERKLHKSSLILN